MNYESIRKTIRMYERYLDRMTARTGVMSLDADKTRYARIDRYLPVAKNYLATVRLLDQCRKRNVDLFHYVLANRLKAICWTMDRILEDPMYLPPRTVLQSELPEVGWLTKRLWKDGEVIDNIRKYNQQYNDLVKERHRKYGKKVEK